MKVKGPLVEGKNGEEYLLGIGPRSVGVQRQRPTIWRVTGLATSLSKRLVLHPRRSGSVWNPPHRCDLASRTTVTSNGS
jgi:hypothetical protein